MNEVDEQLFYGKLRKVSKKMKQLDEMLIVYEKDSQELLEKIEKITEIEKCSKNRNYSCKRNVSGNN